ncbi:MFS transporter [uncultured Bartonella sp.]|uniref:MFS transporter n=1 Tax=uncultured Bartonella sp. TaxID=104108 RepID=UPI0025DD16EB|nr:MFS transporter [uncultured Bartonella sp.]
MAQHKIAIFCLSLSALALGLSSYMTAGLIPLISKDFSVKIGLAAQLVTAFTLPYGLLSPVFVGMTGRRDLKKNICLYLAIFIISNELSILAPEFISLMILRAIAGVSAGAFLACGITASTRLSSSAKKGKSISTIMAGMAVGTVFGVPASLIVAEYFGWRSAISIVSILGAVAWLGLFFSLPRLPATAQTHDKSRFSLIADWSVVRVLLISLFAAVASLGMYTFLAPFVTAVQENAHVTMYLWFWGVGGVCGSILIGYVVDVYDLKKILFFILSLLFIAFLAVFVFSKIDLILIALPLIIWGAVGWALQVPQNNELLKLREQSGDGNLAVGLNQSSVYLGGSLGSILGGILVSFGVNPSSLPLYYMLPIIISILLLVVRRKS